MIQINPTVSGKNSILFALVAILIFLPMNMVYGHEGKDGEPLILSRYIDGDIETSTSSEQWSESFEKDFDSKWDHDISVKSLNNGTNVYFLLSWEDSTKGEDTKVNDGAMIIFESKSENTKEYDGIENMEKSIDTGEIWIWDSIKSNDSTDIIMDATWKNQKWNVLFGRSVLMSEHEKIIFESGIKQEDFIKIVVWDGSAGESVEQIEDLSHADFILLPKIDTHPKDVFVWSTLLVVGAVSFLFVERKLHFKKEELR